MNSSPFFLRCSGERIRRALTIRYDLLVGGPHSSTTADPRSKLQRKLTRKTLAAHRRGGRRKLLLDHLIEEAEGHPVPQEELQRVKALIAKALRDISIAR